MSAAAPDAGSAEVRQSRGKGEPEEAGSWKRLSAVPGVVHSSVLVMCQDIMLAAAPAPVPPARPEPCDAP